TSAGKEKPRQVKRDLHHTKENVAWKCTLARYPSMTIRPLRSQDWIESERAEIRRLEKVCDASELWTLECSQTDVGEPRVYRLRPAAPQDHPSCRPHRETIRGGVAARAAICDDGHHGFSRRHGSQGAKITEATRELTKCAVRHLGSAGSPP